MTFKVPLVVRCIKRVGEATQVKYPGVDFGIVDTLYMVAAVVPNGCYYVLRGECLGDLMGEPGAPNHIVNMDRFEPVQWMSENGIVKA